MEIPQVEIPETGLHDIFLNLMALAMDTTKEEVETILNT